MKEFCAEFAADDEFLISFLKWREVPRLGDELGSRHNRPSPRYGAVGTEDPVAFVASQHLDLCR
jgi:hypothetical protein